MLAFAHAYTSLAGRALLNLLSFPAQAVSAVVPNGRHVSVSVNFASDGTSALTLCPFTFAAFPALAA